MSFFKLSNADTHASPSQHGPSSHAGHHDKQPRHFTHDAKDAHKTAKPASAEPMPAATAAPAPAPGVSAAAMTPADRKGLNEAGFEPF